MCVFMYVHIHIYIYVTYIWRNVTTIYDKRDMNLKQSKKTYIWEGLEVGKGTEKLCNYNLKNKRKTGKILTFHQLM